MKQILTVALAAALSLVVTPASATSKPVRSGDVQLPRISGPLPSTPDSYAFNAAAETQVPQDLAAYGYVEEEYLIRGDGRIYDFPAVGDLRTLGVGEYVTRILVRRPMDNARSNGAVIVEPFNPSRMVDVDLMWILSREHLMREGYAWVGVTFKPSAAKALKSFDAVRYRDLSFNNPLFGARRCADQEIGPNETGSEVGFSFDILSQVGGLLRSQSASNPLNGFNVERVYMTGYSQTAGLARSYAIAIAPVATHAGGRRIFDGYFYVGHAPFNVQFHNCDALNPPGDPRLAVPASGVPTMEVAVEGDVLATSYVEKLDSDTQPYLYRYYEIAGATHSGSLIAPFTPRETDFERAGIPARSSSRCRPSGPAPSNFPLDQVFNAMWQNLDRWVKDGVPPPRGERLRLAGGLDEIARADQLKAQRDHIGNALGGVRTVATEVPIMRWHGQRGGHPACLRIGYSEPLDDASLARLYPTHSDYVARVAAAAKRLHSEQWLTEHDARRIVDAAWHAQPPGSD